MLDKKIFIGIDPSLTGTGIIVLDERGNIIQSKLFNTKSTEEIEARFISIWKEIQKYTQKDSIINIEGVSFNSKGNTLIQLGALHYYIRIMMKKESLNFKVIEPKVLKKFITGSGNAKKNLMLLQVYKKFGIEFSDDNLADAYSLARMAWEDVVKNDKIFD